MEDSSDDEEHQVNHMEISTTQIGNTSVKYCPDPSTILGTGLTAIVYPGYHFGIKKPSAVKFIQKKYIREENDQLNEQDIWTKIDQNINIIRLYDSYRNTKVGLFLAMEKSERTFKKQIIKCTPTREQVIIWLHQIAKAVEYLHGKGVIHRDIKPDNVLMTLQEKNKLVAKLADFGVSKILSSTERTRTFSNAKGTLLWMAPEALNCQNQKFKNTRKLDIYGLGMTMYFGLLKGCHPHSKARGFNIMAKDMLENSYMFDDIVVNKLTSKMMSTEPRDRPNIQKVLSYALFSNWKQEKDFVISLATCLSNPDCEETQEMTISIDHAYASFYRTNNFNRTLNWIYLAKRNNSDVAEIFTTEKRRNFTREYGYGESITKFMKLFRDKYVHYPEVKPEAVAKFSGNDDIFCEETYAKTLISICPDLVQFLYMFLCHYWSPPLLPLYKVHIPWKVTKPVAEKSPREDFNSRENMRDRNTFKFNSDGIFLPFSHSVVVSTNVQQLDGIETYREYPYK